MKILHLSTTDIKGGAGIAAYRLHKGLLDNEIDSQMLVQRKSSKDTSVLCSNSKLEKFFAFFCLASDKIVANIFGPKNYEIVSPALFSSINLRAIDKINPDIVHIHWICGGFLSPEKIKQIKQPIVWTMHDMWPFSGVNHYNADEKNYITGDFENSNFLDRWTFKRKKRAWNSLNNFTAVSPSKWLANEAKASYLFKNFKVENIPNGIDVDLFKKQDKELARKKYNLPLDKKLMLFGAVNPLSGERKGYKLLVSVIQELLKLNINKDLALVVFGSSDDNKVDFGLPTYFIGKISSEEELAIVYSAADIFIAPSREDNLPNTVVESMSCGTPIVAFNIGGMPDMIDHRINGVLVEPFNVSLMAKEISDIFNDENYYNSLTVEARKKVLNYFDIKIVIKKYLELYKSVL